MKILHYDEVDPLEAFQLNINALWWGLTPTRVETYIKYDDRWSDDTFLYTVDKGKITSQVMGLRIPTKTLDGEETVLGVAGVATHPAHKRKGHSTILMKRLHERSREEGMRMAFLLTRASFVAYNLYKKFGYRDMAGFPKCAKKFDRKKKPKKSILRKFKKKDVVDLDGVFKRFSRELYGHVLRQEKYFGWRLRISDSLKDMISVIETEDGVRGYIVKRSSGKDLFVEEIVIPSKRIMDRVFNELERQEKGDYINVFPLAGREQEDYIESRGYRMDRLSWGRCMVAPLVNNLTYKEIWRLYQVNEGKFCLLELDEF